jgi:predicted dithiol-disulfide oxidoreductase (DUF899 family)
MSNMDEAPAPEETDKATYLAQVAALRVHEKAHMRTGDEIAAVRRRLPMVEVDGATSLEGMDGPTTLLRAFEGRRMLIAYYSMWHEGRDAAGQCEGCTFFTTQIRDLSHFHSRDVTYANFSQGPLAESLRYRDFMGWTMPWYSARRSLDILLADRTAGMMNLICYLRRGEQVYETYWTTMRGVEAMDNSYRLLDLTVYGRQESWENSPTGWPQDWVGGKVRMRTGGRPISQWPRIEAGQSDDLDHAPR